jgi:hypothetical protein
MKEPDFESLYMQGRNQGRAPGKHFKFLYYFYMYIQGIHFVRNL